MVFKWDRKVVGNSTERGFQPETRKSDRKVVWKLPTAREFNQIRNKATDRILRPS